MDSSKVITRATRARGKSTPAAGDTRSSSDAEMAPNLNGNKDGVDGDNVAPGVEENAPKEAEGSKDAGRIMRKRKRTDLKSDDDDDEAKDAKEEEQPAATKDDMETQLQPEAMNEKAEPDPEEKSNNLNTSVESAETSDLNTSTEEVSNSLIDSHLNTSINTELNVLTPGSETYGKGKRARVPNKRYSDIIRTAVVRTPKSEHSRPRSFKSASAVHTKNGELPEDDLGEILREVSELEASKEGLLPVKRSKSSVDLKNPCYLKPFDYGWKRELVLRSTYTDGKRNGDIYYYNPSGLKLRSMREVADHLRAAKSRDLSLANFTYFKEPLGLDDPDKEVIREAKRYKYQPGVSVTPMNRKIAASKLIAKSNKRSKTPAGNTSSTTSPSPPKMAKSSKPFKVKAPVKPSVKPPATKKEKKEHAEVEVPTGISNSNATPKKGKANLDRKPCQPCSIRCKGMQGLVPCLQCRICLCLYHNQCVGIDTQVHVKDYVCKNCQMEQEPSDGKSETNLSAASHIPPSSTPFAPAVPPADVPDSENPNPPDKQGIEPSTANLSPSANIKLNNNNAEQKSLVGSLTTWFPPSSTIQVGNNEFDPLSNVPRRPQLVEYIGSKKYVVVPRHNILSVRSPAQADAANSVILNASVNRQDAPASDPACPKSPVEHSAFIPPQAEAASQGECMEELLAPAAAADEKPPPEPVVRTSARSKEQVEEPRPGPPNFMNTYMQNLQYGYTTLFCVFQYLKVQDLLRAGCVCTMWRDMSRYPALWRTVRMKNSQIHSFEGMANALRQHGTVHLDLRKMLLPSNTSTDDIWPSFTNSIKKVESLRRIELCRCLASVVEDLARNNHNLEVINAVTLKCESMTFEPFENLSNLVDLRLKSTAGLTLSSDLSALKSLIKLKHLSITSIKDLNKLNIEVIGELINLEVLDLGECSDFPKHFGPDILSKLSKLEKLRLEKGQGDCHTFDILEAVKELSALQQLELVNFDIKTGFDKSLGACYNIKKLLIIPTYISQSATTNHMVLGGVLRLQRTLSHFVWGVTLELLRVTELFVDQCEQPDKKEPREKGMNSGDSIPVLKPVPLQGMEQTEVAPSTDTPQVEILPLPNLQKLLLLNLPTTRVKILKIPFHATWRQSITDSVN